MFGFIVKKVSVGWHSFFPKYGNITFTSYSSHIRYMIMPVIFVHFHSFSSYYYDAYSIKLSFQNILSACVSFTVGTSKSRSRIMMDKIEPTERFILGTCSRMWRHKYPFNLKRKSTGLLKSVKAKVHKWCNNSRYQTVKGVTLQRRPRCTVRM